MAAPSRYVSDAYVLMWEKCVTAIPARLDLGQSSRQVRSLYEPRSSGSIVCGHCTCMTGQGKTCFHVEAVLSWMETNSYPRSDACTSKESIWIEPTALKDTPYLMLKDIDFNSAKKIRCTHEHELKLTKMNVCGSV